MVVRSNLLSSKTFVDISIAELLSFGLDYGFNKIGTREDEATPKLSPTIISLANKRKSFNFHGLLCRLLCRKDLSKCFYLLWKVLSTRLFSHQVWFYHFSVPTGLTTLWFHNWISVLCKYLKRSLRPVYSRWESMMDRVKSAEPTISIKRSEIFSNQKCESFFPWENRKCYEWKEFVWKDWVNN